MGEPTRIGVTLVKENRTTASLMLAVTIGRPTNLVGVQGVSYGGYHVAAHSVAWLSTGCCMRRQVPIDRTE